ncbi:MAG: putative polymerase ECF-subfamily sigma factor [Acidimicrobiales bacterium]|nr:putative polymerase ECF-subfamily sigma factor [Acidimicrobiales bacterium]
MLEPVEEGFDEFFRANHSALLGCSLAIVGQVELAREIAQESMLRCFRDWHRVRRLDRPDLWVRRVAVNLAIDDRRRFGREQRRMARHGPAPSAEAVTAEMSYLWGAVRALPAQQRAAVVLRYVDDLSVAEIAIVLKVADGTVKSSLSRARTTLSKMLSEEVEIDG